MSQMDGGEKAEFTGLPADGKAGGWGPSVLLLWICLGFGNRQKKAVSKEEAKPINGLNPGQLHLQQTSLPWATQIPELSAIKPEFHKFSVVAEVRDCRFGSES